MKEKFDLEFIVIYEIYNYVIKNSCAIQQRMLEIELNINDLTFRACIVFESHYMPSVNNGSLK